MRYVWHCITGNEIQYRKLINQIQKQSNTHYVNQQQKKNDRIVAVNLLQIIIGCTASECKVPEVQEYSIPFIFPAPQRF